MPGIWSFGPSGSFPVAGDELYGYQLLVVDRRVGGEMQVPSETEIHHFVREQPHTKTGPVIETVVVERVAAVEGKTGLRIVQEGLLAIAGVKSAAHIQYPPFCLEIA